MDWFISCLTITAMELIARKHWQGWAVGLANQGFWAWFMYSKQAYGLLPISAILTWRYSVALVRWRRDEARGC